ncbi:DUF3127 domain-containing protein [Spirosoma luteum]|uniref:DUF3127 domain-containing protein n=1 Tax=Spirosoma luteum TaxID=431553 RepID=UPI00036C7B3B|nr:DUF3127 domain-containing protein [Spirosoma luteum]
MDIKGAFVKQLEQKTGQGKNGPWIKREFVINTGGQYPKEVCIEAFNDKGDLVDGFVEGEEISVSYDLESREYNGRYYTAVKAYKISSATTGASSGGSAPRQQSAQKQEPVFQPTQDESNDLPF